MLLGVTGGIAAYKACELDAPARQGRARGRAAADARAPSASSRAETFRALARRPRGEGPFPHLERADLLVVAPLTANTLAKLAHGLADNVLTEAALAHRGPVLVAPAMNPRMWAHAATQANVDAAARARRRAGRPGRRATPPRASRASGGWPSRRRSSRAAQELLARRRARSRAGACSSRAGGTREPLDAVRFLGNRSSGRMGVALAAEARRRGAEVTLLAANLAVAPPAGVEVVETPTAAELLEREARAAPRRRPRPDGRGGRRLPPGRRDRGQAAEGRRRLDGRARADRRTSSASSPPRGATAR